MLCYCKWDDHPSKDQTYDCKEIQCGSRILKERDGASKLTNGVILVKSQRV